MPVNSDQINLKEENEILGFNSWGFNVIMGDSVGGEDKKDYSAEHGGTHGLGELISGPVVVGFDKNSDAMVDGNGKEAICKREVNGSEEGVLDVVEGEWNGKVGKGLDGSNGVAQHDKGLDGSNGVAQQDKGLVFEQNDGFYIELKCENAGKVAEGVNDDLIECRQEDKRVAPVNLSAVNVNGNQTHDFNIVEASLSENIQHDCRDCNLVVDFTSYIKNTQEDGIGMYGESLFSDVNYCVSDLVWGKVRGHPWWPGQIYDPSIASEKAMRYFKENCYLIAYFGDQTFAWNDVSMIKPFQVYFSQMEKQSNLENFRHAVDCALEEVSRRVEFGMHCPCMPEKVMSKLKTQVIVNDGVIKQSSTRNGGDRFMNATSFEPMKLVNFVKSLAQSPHVEFDRLDFVTTRAQLTSFYRSKGYSQLPEFAANWLFKNDMETILVNEEEQYDDQHALNTHLGFLQTSKHISRNGKQHDKKLKLVSDLMSEKNCFISNCGNLTPQRRRGRKRKIVDSSDDSSQVKKPTQLQYLSTDEMWSQLCLAAKEPIGESCFGDMIYFFGEFQKFTGLDDSVSMVQGPSLAPMHGGETTRVTSMEAMTSMTTTMELCNDSYWTDRMIQGISEEQPLLNYQNEREEFLPEIPTEANPLSFKSAEIDTNVSRTEQDGNSGSEPSNLVEDLAKSSAEIDTNVSLMEQDRNSGSEPSNLVEDLANSSPTALTLKFTNLDSVPSTKDLNMIFGRFGPLIEPKTELLRKSNRARVIFKRRCDAETAFSSAGKYSIFGPSLVSYRLQILSRVPTKGTGKRGRPRKERSKP